jgi:hypothetical protein
MRNTEQLREMVGSVGANAKTKIPFVGILLSPQGSA